VSEVRSHVRASGTAITLLLLAAVLVTGCGSGNSSGAASSTSGSVSAGEPTFTVTVVGKKITGVPSRVTLSPGEKVRLIVTADRTSVLHVHAGDPEIETHTQQGQAVTVEFSVKKNAGLYEVEMHDPDLLLFQVEVK
jgi:plastocyanin